MSWIFIVFWFNFVALQVVTLTTTMLCYTGVNYGASVLDVRDVLSSTKLFSLVDVFDCGSSTPLLARLAVFQFVVLDLKLT